MWSQKKVCFQKVPLQTFEYFINFELFSEIPSNLWIVRIHIHISELRPYGQIVEDPQDPKHRYFLWFSMDDVLCRFFNSMNKLITYQLTGKTNRFSIFVKHEKTMSLSAHRYGIVSSRIHSCNWRGHRSGPRLLMTKNYFKKLIPSYKNDVFYFAFPEGLPSSREASIQAISAFQTSSFNIFIFLNNLW